MRVRLFRVRTCGWWYFRWWRIRLRFVRGIRPTRLGAFLLFSQSLLFLRFLWLASALVNFSIGTERLRPLNPSGF